MEKLLTKLSFKPVEGSESKFKIPSVPVWYTCTLEVEPNDWSVRVKFVEDVKSDNTVMAEIDFLVKEKTGYLMVPGTKFKLFGGFTAFDCMVEVIEVI
jgi:hypothetical protein